MKLIFLNTWKKVFSKPKYLILAIVIAVLFYSLNVLISSWRSLESFYFNLGLSETIKIFFSILLNFYKTTIISSYISLIIISILFGILLSLVVYKVNLGITAKVGLLGWFGIFLAAFVPGCLACSVGLLAILGIGAGALAFLPYKGLEISVIAILILGFSIIKLSNDTCKIKS